VVVTVAADDDDDDKSRRAPAKCDLPRALDGGRTSSSTVRTANRRTPRCASPPAPLLETALLSRALLWRDARGLRLLHILAL
jgi:hypothetical protein